MLSSHRSLLQSNFANLALGIYLIAATNRPEMIDEAMLRPGRLETPLVVDLPGADERVEILKALLRKASPPGVGNTSTSLLMSILRGHEYPSPRKRSSSG